ncbi:MAG: sensor histidine kinase [Limnohabitans sp.]
MTPPKFLKYFSDRLDSSAKILVLVTVTAVLTVTAIMVSADFIQERRMNVLREQAQAYTAALQIKIKNEEDYLQSIAALVDANSFVGFGQSAKRLMEDNPSYVNIELRDDMGTLIGRRASPTGPEAEPSNLRQQLPPGVLLSFLRANEQQKVLWAHSYSSVGKYSTEMIVPSKTNPSLWLVRIDPNYWLPPQSRIPLDSSIQVSMSDQLEISQDKALAMSTSLDLPGTKAYLQFNYKAKSNANFDGMTVLTATLGLLICVLLVHNAWDAKRHRDARETIAKQEMVLVKQGQLSTLGEVSTALAHELNQPLATIANYVAACEMRVKSQGYDDPILEEALSNARKQAMRAGEVVQSIRNYLKRRPNVTAGVEIEEILNELKPILLMSANEHQTKLTIETERNLSTRIDPALLEQVVLNFCRNGIDAMLETETSQRQLQIRAFSYPSDDGTEWMRIDVSDAGHGVHDDHAPRLFESFFSTKENGMGIGLGLCRSVAESYGGRIQWQNNPQGGATFSLLLPKAQPA